MIRRSNSKAKNKKTSKKTKVRKTSFEKPTYICKKCPKKKPYTSSSKQDMALHFEKKHNKKRSKGVDLKMFFEVLRVMGVVGIVIGVYGISTYVADQYVETTPELANTKNGIEKVTGAEINIDQSDIVTDE